MLQVFQQIVIKSILVVGFFILTQANAETFDINEDNTIEVNAYVGKYNVFDFDFKIEKINSKTKRIETIKEEDKLSLLNSKPTITNTDENLLNTKKDSKPPLPSPSKGKDNPNKGATAGETPTPKSTPTSSRIVKEITVKGNILEIYPSSQAVYEIMITGGSKPVLLTVKAVTENAKSSYTQIKDTGRNKNSEIFFESKNEKQNYLNMFRYLHADKDLPEFRNNEQEEILNFYDGKLQATLKKHYQSDEFIVKEYWLENELPYDYYIVDDLFKINENIVALSFDTQDNYVYQGKGVRYFSIEKIYQ